MAVEVYDQVFPYLQGALASEATQVSTQLMSDIQKVSTLVKDLAGFTPSPVMREISVENVIPIGGIEFDVEGYFIRREIVTMKLVFGGSGKAYEGRGFITDVKIDAGVGKTTSLSFTFTGEGKAFA